MLKIALLGVSLCFFECLVFGQSQKIDSVYQKFDRMYGLDPDLHNGKKFIPDAPSSGNPFWGSEGSFCGDITLSGKTFKNQQLRYNISKQNFLLLYPESNGQKCQIVLNSALVDSVRSGKDLFVRNPCPETGSQFVKEIYRGRLHCFIVLEKKLELSQFGSNTGYSYSEETRTNFLLYKKQVRQFKREASFVRIFPKGKRAVIRNKISGLRIKFRKLDDGLLRQLVVFCDHTVLND